MSQQPKGNSTPLRRQELLPRPFHGWKIALGITLAVLAIIEIQYAEQSFDFFYTNLRDHFSFLDDYFATTRQTGSTFGIALTIIVWLFCPRARHTLIPFGVAILISSVLVMAIKETTGRSRPPYGVRMHTHSEEMDEVWAYLEENPNPVLRPERGDYWLWFSPHRPHFRGDYASFPSGHATSAVIIAVYLSMIAPKAKYLWWILAIGTAVSRVRFLRHHPGDILFGAGLGLLTVYWVFAAQWPNRLGHWAATRGERLLGSPVRTLPADEYDRLHGGQPTSESDEEALPKSGANNSSDGAGTPVESGEEERQPPG